MTDFTKTAGIAAHMSDPAREIARVYEAAGRALAAQIAKAKSGEDIWGRETLGGILRIVDAASRRSGLGALAHIRALDIEAHRAMTGGAA